MLSKDNQKQLIKDMRNRNIKFENEGAYWTPDEKSLLEELFCEGVGISEIALELKRKEQAIVQQIEKMDLYQRAMHQQRHRRAQRCKCLCPNCDIDMNLCPFRKNFNEQQEVL